MGIKKATNKIQQYVADIGKVEKATTKSIKQSVRPSAFRFTTRRKLMDLDHYQFLSDYSKGIDVKEYPYILDGLTEIDTVLEGGIGSKAIERLVRADFDEFRLNANVLTQLPYEQFFRKYLNLRYWHS